MRFIRDPPVNKLMRSTLISVFVQVNHTTLLPRASARFNFFPCLLVWPTGLISVWFRYEFIELHWTVVRVLDSEQTLPRVNQTAKMGSTSKLVLFFLWVIREKSIPHIVKMPVHVDRAALWKKARRLMRQVHTTINHGVTCKVKPILHPPLATTAIVVSTHKHLSSWPGANNCHIVVFVSYTYIAKMNQQVFRFHGGFNVSVDTLRKIVRANAVRLNLFMVQMRVANQVCLHSNPHSQSLSSLICSNTCCL